MQGKKASLIAWAVVAAFLAGTPAARVSAAAPAEKYPPAPKIKVVDADNHSIVLNRIGIISVVLGTSEDSQDAARRAGKAMYPFQGRPDFQLVVLVDLRDSIASWMPSVVIDHMRRSLDDEAVELKPYFAQNGNKQNPRHFLHVVADFKGGIVPLLCWSGTPDELHGTLFGSDGRELKKWENIDSGNMEKFQADVRAALEAHEAWLAKNQLPPNGKSPDGR